MPRLGETVSIRVVANNIFLETRGRVTRVGRPGEPLEVTTTDGIRLTGTVIGPGLVEVRG
jgi:flagella basal body P-ring formation protein FlgA